MQTTHLHLKVGPFAHGSSHDAVGVRPHADAAAPGTQSPAGGESHAAASPWPRRTAQRRELRVVEGQSLGGGGVLWRPRPRGCLPLPEKPLRMLVSAFMQGRA